TPARAERVCTDETVVRGARLAVAASADARPGIILRPCSRQACTAVDSRVSADMVPLRQRHADATVRAAATEPATSFASNQAVRRLRADLRSPSWSLRELARCRLAERPSEFQVPRGATETGRARVESAAGSNGLLSRGSQRVGSRLRARG